MRFNYSNMLCLRHHGKNLRPQPLGRRPTGNVTPARLSWEQHGRVQSRTPILGPD
jgi:hypothetical protein